jgi:hypothetical protein
MASGARKKPEISSGQASSHWTSSWGMGSRVPSPGSGKLSLAGRRVAAVHGGEGEGGGCLCPTTGGGRTSSTGCLL